MSHLSCSLENQSSFDSLIRTNSRVAQCVHESDHIDCDVCFDTGHTACLCT